MGFDLYDNQVLNPLKKKKKFKFKFKFKEEKKTREKKKARLQRSTSNLSEILRWVSPQRISVSIFSNEILNADFGIDIDF